MGVRSLRVPQQRLFAVGALAAILFLFAALIPARAQDKNPLAKDPNAAKLGEFEFRANCAFCHGLGARGGGRGPDLTRVQKKHGNSDADIFRRRPWDRNASERSYAAGCGDDRRRNLASGFLYS